MILHSNSQPSNNRKNKKAAGPKAAARAWMKWFKATLASERKAARKRRPVSNPTTKGQCRDCKKTEPVKANLWGRAANPRCGACGGMLEQIGAPLPYASTPKGKVVVTQKSKRRHPNGPR